MASPIIEERVSALERQMEQLLREKGEAIESESWIHKWFGAFKDNPDFDAAMRQGEKYRKSQPIAAHEQDQDGARTT
jgi:hypothetical protein